MGHVVTCPLPPLAVDKPLILLVLKSKLASTTTLLYKEGVSERESRSKI